jgi:hypothetical protein
MRASREPERRRSLIAGVGVSGSAGRRSLIVGSGRMPDASDATGRSRVRDKRAALTRRAGRRHPLFCRADESKQGSVSELRAERRDSYACGRPRRGRVCNATARLIRRGHRSSGAPAGERRVADPPQSLLKRAGSRRLGARLRDRARGHAAAMCGAAPPLSGTLRDYGCRLGHVTHRYSRTVPSGWAICQPPQPDIGFPASRRSTSWSVADDTARPSRRDQPWSVA